MNFKYWSISIDLDIQNNCFPQKVLIAAQSGKYVERKVKNERKKEKVHTAPQSGKCVKRKGKNNKEKRKGKYTRQHNWVNMYPLWVD